jgi:hypothetical protein
MAETTYLAEEDEIPANDEQDHQIDLATALGIDVSDVSGGPQSHPMKRR